MERGTPRPASPERRRVRARSTPKRCSNCSTAAVRPSAKHPNKLCPCRAPAIITAMSPAEPSTALLSCLLNRFLRYGLLGGRLLYSLLRDGFFGRHFLRRSLLHRLLHGLLSRCLLGDSLLCC